jgi:very-short-patch-repair endonuclease
MSRLAGRSAWQLDALADRLAPELQLESWLVRLALGFAPGVATPLLGVASLRNVERLLGELPPLLVDPAEPSTDALSHAARMLVELAEAVPRADLALAVDGSLLTPLSATLRGRLATAFAEGLILLHESVGEPLNATHPAAAFIEYSGASFARSRAEMKLFELLNDRERTKGLFSLNRKLEPLDDGTVLEVDLLCQDLMLAVEVDGYHHFRDAGGYRRDRRKDVRLQDLGYLVVRVLAADVEDEISHVIETIDAVVDRRRRRTE